MRSFSGRPSVGAMGRTNTRLMVGGSVTLAAILSSAIGLPAQSPDSWQPSPESAGVVYLEDVTNRALKPLPGEAFADPQQCRVGSIIKPTTTKAGKAIGVVLDEDRRSGWSSVEGDHSALRLTDRAPRFTFRFDTPENAVLYRLVVGFRSCDPRHNEAKPARYFSSVVVSGGIRLKIGIAQGVPVTITPAGESVYRLTPKEALSPGEYALMLRGPNQTTKPTVYTFAVDSIERVPTPN